MGTRKLNIRTVTKMFPSHDENGLLIHHWDADGICSAAIIFEYIGKNIDSRIPYIGNYYLTVEEIANISKQEYDFIIMADMALPEENILQLKKKSGAEIYIFDHHLQDIIPNVHHNNPISRGEPAEKYPSNSWVLSVYLKREIDLLSVLGAVGDNEEKIKKNQEIYPEIEAFLERSDLVFDDLLAMVELIDSNYKSGNREMVLDAATFIKENKLSPQAILENKEWKQNLNKIDEEIAQQSNTRVKFIGGVAIQEINTSYNIISTLTRQLAWNSGSKASIMVNRGYFDNEDQIYIRAGDSSITLKPIINIAMENGYSAGGKREVAGIVLPKEDTDHFIVSITDKLNELIGGVKI